MNYLGSQLIFVLWHRAKLSIKRRNKSPYDSLSQISNGSPFLLIPLINKHIVIICLLLVMSVRLRMCNVAKSVVVDDNLFFIFRYCETTKPYFRVMGPAPWYLNSKCNHNIAYYVTLPYQSYGFNLVHLLVNQIIIPTMTGVDLVGNVCDARRVSNVASSRQFSADKANVPTQWHEHSIMKIVKNIKKNHK